MYLLAIFLPPVAVLACGKPGQALLNLVLTIFGWIPGMIHGLFVVSAHKADARNAQLMSQAAYHHAQTLDLMYRQAEIEAARLGIAPPPRPAALVDEEPATGPSDGLVALLCIGGVLVVVAVLVSVLR